MKDCLLVYAALSQVKRIKKVLEANGDYFDIVRSPHCLSAGGCSFSIRCAVEDIPRIAAITRDQGIALKGAYRERGPQGRLGREAKQGESIYEPIALES
jgi:hypothetical protein